MGCGASQRGGSCGRVRGMNEEQATRIAIQAAIIAAIPGTYYLLTAAIERWAASGSVWGRRLKRISDYLNTGWTLTSKKRRRKPPA